ncbi:2-hydroxyacid dehydrogenase [Myroides sp. LJL119]
MIKKVLHIDSNHPLLLEELEKLGYQNIQDYTSDKQEILKTIDQYTGIVIRSRFALDKDFLEKATNLKFIARVGAGLENIDCLYAQSKDIALINAPEGNQTAVAEHAMGMLLCLMNKLKLVDYQVRNGVWIREDNRGYEIQGKTVAIIGYGHMGKAFAKRLSGFDCRVICYDILQDVGDKYAQQVSLNEVWKNADIISLHTPQTPDTLNLLNRDFFDKFQKPFFLINTARGKSLNTQDLVQALQENRILGAALDVLEYEKSSFENMFSDNDLPGALQYLLQSDKVLLSPHIAGWTHESKLKLAQTIIEKLKLLKL